MPILWCKMSDRKRTREELIADLDSWRKYAEILETEKREILRKARKLEIRLKALVKAMGCGGEIKS